MPLLRQTVAQLHATNRKGATYGPAHGSTDRATDRAAYGPADSASHGATDSSTDCADVVRVHPEVLSHCSTGSIVSSALMTHSVSACIAVPWPGHNGADKGHAAACEETNLFGKRHGNESRKRCFEGIERSCRFAAQLRRSICSHRAGDIP